MRKKILIVENNNDSRVSARLGFPRPHQLRGLFPPINEDSFRCRNLEVIGGSAGLYYFLPFPEATPASSCSINLVKASRGWAPVNVRPLTKKAGVPVIPSRLPSSRSHCTAALWVSAARQLSNFVTSTPTCPA